MTIQEKAIEQLERISRHLAAIGEKEDYTDVAIQALEQECEDAVNRQAVLDEVEQMRKPSEIIVNGKTLEEILENHKHWLKEDVEGWENMGADLSDADLYRADLTDADLYGADLSYANLSGAKLSDCNLGNANLSEAYGSINYREVEKNDT